MRLILKTLNRLDPVLTKRIFVRVLIIVSLYPILLGGVANMPQKYRAAWREMRREHREAVERDRARRRLLDAVQSNLPIAAPPELKGGFAASSFRK